MGLIVEISKKPLWNRSVALHEAGHAIAAWISGSRHIEIALANEFRIAYLSNGKQADDCRAVCSSQLASHELIDELVISFAGVMAQHLYTGEAPEALLKIAKGDARDIETALDEYHRQGATLEERQIMHDKAYSLSLKLVTRYWWEIIALAKMLEHHSYLPQNKVSGFLSHFLSLQSPRGILQELDS